MQFAVEKGFNADDGSWTQLLLDARIAFLALRVLLSARRALGRKHKPSLSPRPFEILEEKAVEGIEKGLRASKGDFLRLYNFCILSGLKASKIVKRFFLKKN